MQSSRKGSVASPGSEHGRASSDRAGSSPVSRPRFSVPGLPSPVLRMALLALLLAAACPARGAAPAGPGRIAVLGAFPSGYVGLLARNGLPRDIVLDYQLGDPAFLSRYDLVIIAGLSGEGARLLLPRLRGYVEEGGRVLLDCSGVADPIPGGLTPFFTSVGGAQSPRRVAGFQVAGESNPLRQDVGTDVTFPAARVVCAPTMADASHTTLLARYLVAAPRAPRQAPRRGTRATAPTPPAAVPGAPAIVLEQRGKGKMVLCGPALGQAIALMGFDGDRLILGMLRLLTDGRVTPQLTPEGVRLARKQSSRSLAKSASKAPVQPAAPPAAEPPAPATPSVPDRPAGPGSRGALPKGFALIEADPGTEYNLSGNLSASGGEVLLNYWNGANHLRVRLSRSGVRITRATGGRSFTLAGTATPVPAGAPFVIKERSQTLMVVAGPAVVTASAAGLCQGSAACQGTQGQVRYQPTEPAAFSDDFMRTSDDPGGWETHGGTWKTAPVQNPDMGANPFSYKVEAGTDPATSLAGFPYWDDYRFSASVRPEVASGSIGMGIYAQDADNMLLFRARVQDDGQPTEDGFALVRLSNGRPEVLAQYSGSLRPRQWYRVDVKAQGPWIGVTIDGVRVLAARDMTFAGGQIALRAEAATARFDDVLVEPSSTVAGAGRRLVGRIPDWAGIIDVDSWAGPATLWDADPAAAGLFWRRGAFYGDVGMRFEVPALPAGGKAALLVDGDGRSPESACTLTLSQAGSGATLELSRGGALLGKASLPANAATVIGLRREGNHLVALADGRALLRAPYVPGPGCGRLGFRAVGFQPRISTLAIWSASVRDYTFDTAPVDWWVSSGEWDVTNRWSCTPDWSWFGGASSQVAAIWYKHRFEGNLVLDFYAGPKMLTDGTKRKESLADFNAAICGDGVDVKSGYGFVVAENGSGAKILKQGQVVAQEKSFRLFTQGHNRWANVRVEKHGGRLSLFVEGQLVLEYTDPAPLAGGYAGVWTQDNGIMVPRISLYYEALGSRCLSLM